MNHFQVNMKEKIRVFGKLGLQISAVCEIKGLDEDIKWVFETPEEKNS